MKLAIVGAGSTYTPEVVEGLVRTQDSLAVTELAMHDVSPERLDLLAAMSERMLAAGDHPAVVTTHTDLAPAADGAEMVLVQLRVGGQAARLTDERLHCAAAVSARRPPAPGDWARRCGRCR